jgi:hypothetical protein
MKLAIIPGILASNPSSRSFSRLARGRDRTTTPTTQRLGVARQRSMNCRTCSSRSRVSLGEFWHVTSLRHTFQFLDFASR